MRLFRSAACLAIGLAATAPRLPAQDADARAILDLVVAHAAQERGFTDYTAVHPDSGRQTFMRCPTAPSSCRLDGDRPAVQGSRPEVEGNRATVYVRTWEPTTSQGRPIYRITRHYTLIRRGNRWMIAESRIQSMT